MHHYQRGNYLGGNNLQTGWHSAPFFHVAYGMDELVVHAPSFLGTDSRSAFYDDALAQLTALAAKAPAGGARLVIDLSRTSGIDSMGLSTLVLIQLLAAERRQTVALRGASEEVRFLLLMTRLEDRFDIESQS